MIDMDIILGPVAITLGLGAAIILLFFWSAYRRLNYWKKRGVPSAKAIPILGSLYELHFKPFQDMENDRYKELGRVYGHYESHTPLLSVAEPALLRDILVKDFVYFHDRRDFNTGIQILDKMLSAVPGEDWKRIRSIVSPTFSTGKIKRMLSIFKECSETLCHNFKAATESNKCVEVRRLYGAFTMDVIASSAFSTKIDSHNDPDNRFVQMAKKTLTGGLTWRFVLFFVAPWIMKLFKINVFEQEPMDFFEQVTHQIVEERRKSGKSRHDFLQLLMDTAKEVSEEEKWGTEDKNDITSNYGENEIEKQILKTVTSKHLSMDELVAQCIIFFLAGYHTTYSTLTFATYSLALNTEIQDKLRKEVDDVLKANNGLMTYEALQDMKYLDNIISETMRLYPPSLRLERVANTDYELGDTGITIPKGMVVSMPVFAIHRDVEFFPEPEKFDPDRFTPEERGIRDPYTYLPFGAGPRNCVGMRFALAEIKASLVYMVSNFIFKRCPETKVPLEIVFTQGLLQPGDVILELEIREDSPLVK